MAPQIGRSWPLANVGLSALLAARFNYQNGSNTVTVASALQVDRTAVSYWKNGRNLPSYRLLPLLAKAIHCDLTTVQTAYEASRSLQHSANGKPVKSARKKTSSYFTVDHLTQVSAAVKAMGGRASLETIATILHEVNSHG